jgi:hypothetical protein
MLVVNEISKIPKRNVILIEFFCEFFMICLIGKVKGTGNEESRV